MLPRDYSTLPRLPDAGLLQRYLETLGIIVPIARVNMVQNPSFETNTTNWGATGVGTSIARSTEQQYHGAYSLKVTLDTGAGGSDDGAGYGAVTGLSTTAGTTYAISAKVRGVPGVGYYLAFGTSTVSPLARVGFTGTGRWQWIWLLVTESSTSTNRQIFIVRDGTGGSGAVVNAPIYIDGVQCEVCEAGSLWPTTYIDGDQLGLVPNQSPPAYGWTGTPHGSTSYRTGQTRAGGRIVRLKDLGFLLTTIIGLGMAPPAHQALTFAQLDGGQYQNTLKPPRTFSLAGRVAANTPNGADVAISQIARLLDRDLVAQRQPLVLTTQAQHCGADCGERVFIQALYSGGLEGLTSELPTAQVPISFTQYLPYITAGDGGVALDVQDSVANANGIIRRTTGGVWAALGSGVSGGGAVVYAVVQGRNGIIYVGGDFTDAGGTGADYLAAYNPATNTWSALQSTTAINGVVRALAVGPDGRIYAGGGFTNAGGNASADGVAVYNPAFNTWSNLGTGTAGQIFALAFGPDGTLYAGGNFTSIGGIGADYIARWDGSTWSNLTSDTALNGVAQALAYGNGRLYVGGGFTNAGGVAAGDYIASWTLSGGWAAVGSGMSSDVLALAIGLNGYVYAGGTFTTAGGVSASRIAVWNGQAWAPLGTGADNTVWSLAVASDSTIYVGGAFSTIGGLSFGSGLARWNGSVWTRPDMLFPGSAIVYALLALPDGTLYAGNDQSGTAFSAAATIATNNGSVDIWPTLIISATTASTVRINQLTNVTTGKTIYFSLVLNAGEVATLTLNPTNISFVSNFQGDIIGSILPGSQSAFFTLQPGANTITTFLTDPNATVTLQWPTGYARLSDALYEAVAP